MKSGTMVVVALVAILVVSGAVSFVFMRNSDVSLDEDRDFAGYEIKPVENLDNGIVVSGVGAFRWVTYFGLADKVIMADMNDSTNYLGKAFMYVGKGQALAAHSDLKFTSENGKISSSDVEFILNSKPSLVIVPATEEVENKTVIDAIRGAGINVYCIGEIYSFITEGSLTISSDFIKQINGLAKVLGMKERGEEIKKVVNDTLDDLESLRGKIDNRRSGYIGALSYGGARGVNSSIQYYMPFALAGIDNVMDGVEGTINPGSNVGTFSADKIASHINKDTILFLDATGMQFSAGDNESKGILKLFSGNTAFIACPYIWTGLNFENVLVGAYQIMHDVYGLMSDEELSEKIDSVYRGFLGTSDSTRTENSGAPAPTEKTSVYDDMNAVFMSKRGNPIHGTITISESGEIKW